MKYRRLGRTELRVSVIGLGAFPFGGEWGHTFLQGEIDGILGRAQEFGINLIDTAECYGRHLSETLIGNAIHSCRDKWIIATKFGHEFVGFQNRREAWSPAEVQRQLEESLRALRTDHVDLYQFHSGSDEAFQRDELWSMLNRQVAAGKIRNLGLSIGYPYSAAQLEAVIKRNIGVIQVRYNWLERVAEESVLPYCQANDLGVLVRVPLFSGFLSGKYGAQHSFPLDDHRSTLNRDGWDSRAKAIEDLARNTKLPSGITLAQWALCWCLHRAGPTSVIPGCKTLAQAEENARAADALDNLFPERTNL